MKIPTKSQKEAGICFAQTFRIQALLLILMSGCASHRTHVHLYDVYGEYAYSIRDRDYENVVDDLLSSSMKMRGMDDIDAFSEYYPVLSNLPDILKRESAHYEFRDEDFGCLTLNGFDQLDRPAVIKMEFLREQGRWKLDYVSVDYLYSKAGFMKAAVCPKR